MKKIILTLLIVCAGMSFSFAQETESVTTLQVKNSETITSDRMPATNKWALVMGDGYYANHFLNTQEYSGDLTGLEYLRIRNSKKYENISYRFSFIHLRNMHRKLLGGGLENNAGTSYISIQNYEFDYAVFYNWRFFDALHLRAGGSVNLYGGFMMGDDHAINNMISVDVQAQVYAAMQAKYGWDYKKFGLDIYANISFPVFGLMAVDGRYEGMMESLAGSSFTANEYSHLKFSSMHNLQGVNVELGVGFALKKHTLSFSLESRNRWWHAHEIQNYRENILVKLGISFNLFSYQNAKTNNRQF